MGKDARIRRRRLERLSAVVKLTDAHPLTEGQALWLRMSPEQRQRAVEAMSGVCVCPASGCQVHGR